MRTAVHRLAEYVVRQRELPLPDDALHHAKRAVVDWFGVTLAGGSAAPAILLSRALASEGWVGDAAVYPSGRRIPGRVAALINGTASHTLELDDIFRDALYHPGSPVIAAALAAAQVRRATGDAFLRAVVTGYELSTRVGVAINPAHYDFWHTTGTVGTLGAAAAVASILGLDFDESAHALATAATFAAGLRQAFQADAMSKPLHAGRAAEGGTLAAMAAAEGVTGDPDILDGPRGFGRAMSRACDWSTGFEDLGERYNITRITAKRHACCGHAFAAVDGALALRDQHGFAPGQIQRITVDTYRTAVEVTGNRNPFTPFEAKFSLPFVTSTALIHGAVWLDAYTPERLVDPVVRNLMDRVELGIDPVIDAGFPYHRGAMVAVTTSDGRTVRHHQPTREGDPDRPLSDEQLCDKFNLLAAPVLGPAMAGALRETLWSLDRMEIAELPDVRPTAVMSDTRSS